jgi:hypothetical protein
MVRFVQAPSTSSGGFLGSLLPRSPGIVADRAFNSLNATNAYLNPALAGVEGAQVKASHFEAAVQQEPQNPNRQILRLTHTLPVEQREAKPSALTQAAVGHDPAVDVTQSSDRWPGERQLVATVIARNHEVPAPDEFIATEMIAQQFRGAGVPYSNQVEITTHYLYCPEQGTIQGHQYSGVYLSPQDPDYLLAVNRPVALYHYRLTLQSPDPSHKVTDTQASL